MSGSHSVIFIPDRPMAAFSLRLHSALQELGHRVTYLTHRYHLVRSLRAKGLDVRLLKRVREANEVSGCERTIQYVGGVMSLVATQQFAQSSLNILQQLHAEQPIDMIMGVNGDSAMGQATRTFATSHGVRTLYLELSNLPGKLMVDAWGVNAQSELCAKPQDVLNRFDVDLNDYATWKADYLEQMQQSHQVQQTHYWSRNLVTRLADWCWDQIGYTALGAVGAPSTAHRLRPLWRRHVSLTATINALPERFVFFPLQVTNDTQLLLNSDLDNLTALQQAKELADSQGAALVIKPHPAEEDTAYLKVVRELCEAQQIHISHDNIMALIKGAQSVITVNSTVGLQAMIAGKDVTFLGRSFYAAFNDERDFARYILGYLLPIDFFSKSPLSAEQANALIARAGVVT